MRIWRHRNSISLIQNTKGELICGDDLQHEAVVYFKSFLAPIIQDCLESSVTTRKRILVVYVRDL